jgi:hypothetical protein
MRTVSSGLATKADQQTFQEDRQAEYESLKEDIQNLSRKELQALKEELDKIAQDSGKMKSSMTDDVTRAHGGVRLDINLEKARIKDEAV